MVDQMMQLRKVILTLAYFVPHAVCPLLWPVKLTLDSFGFEKSARSLSAHTRTDRLCAPELVGGARTDRQRLVDVSYQVNVSWTQVVDKGWSVGERKKLLTQAPLSLNGTNMF